MTIECTTTTAARPILEVENVSKWFGPLMALNDLSLIHI